jgi:hypothetical protein
MAHDQILVTKGESYYLGKRGLDPADYDLTPEWKRKRMEAARKAASVAEADKAPLRHRLTAHLVARTVG